MTEAIAAWLAGEGLGGWRLPAVLAVYLLAGAVKGALGFGLPLIAGALLPQFVPLPLVLAVNAVLLPITNVVQFARAGDVAATLRAHWPVVAGLALAVPLGAFAVAAADPRWVAFAFGTFVALAALATLATPAWRIAPHLRGPAAAATGLAGGLVAALTTAPGPVFVLYLVGTGVGRRETLAALGLFLLASGLLVGVSFLALGVLDAPRAALALACLVPALAGMALGDVLGARVRPERLRTVVLALLVLLGLRTALLAALG